MMPLVSVITPSLDRAGFLRRCLDSVRRQAYPHVEHIVIDGGSTDGTIDLLEEYEQLYNMRWVSEPDRGMYDAINKGLRLATGGILAYLNTDDLYWPWTIATAAAALEDHDLVYGDLFIIKATEERPTSYLQFYKPFDPAYYTHVGTIAQPTVFWNRAVDKALGGFDTARFSLLADCDYWLRAAASGFAIHHVDEVLAIQVDHSETLRETQVSRLAEEFRALRTHHSLLAPRPPSPTFVRLAASFTGRAQLISLLMASLSRDPAHWPAFVTYMRREGLRVSPQHVLARLALPDGLRRRWIKPLVQPESILEALTSAKHGSQSASEG